MTLIEFVGQSVELGLSIMTLKVQVLEGYFFFSSIVFCLSYDYVENLSLLKVTKVVLNQYSFSCYASKLRLTTKIRAILS